MLFASLAYGLCLTLSICIAAVALLVICQWQFRRITYRRVFAKRGMDWDHAAAAVCHDTGYLVVDYAIGYSMGLADVTVWFVPLELTDHDAVGFRVFSVGKLTNCPKSERSFSLLCERFGTSRVLENYDVPCID